MSAWKIGIIGDSLRLAPRAAVAKAKELGADGVSLYAVSGAFSAESLDRQARADFRACVADHGMEIASLVGDLGGHGFQDREENVAKLPRMRAIVDLAADLGTGIVTTHIGVVPGDRVRPDYAVMVEACRELGRYAANRGVTLAIETGPEPAHVLHAFLDDVGTRGIGVNLDPANLAMVVRDDPVRAVHTLAPYLVSTHAKDGRNLQPCDAGEVYGAFAEGGFAELEGHTGALFEEVPLGQGHVPWKAYLAALKAVGFTGYLTIEREVGADPAADIAQAVRFLRERI
jgi:sugar phosphate isomerase/epimerase